MIPDPLAGVSPQTEQGERTSANPAEDARDAPICERCGKSPIVGMWSPDGLPGHEILVCFNCWDYLNAEVPDE